MQPLPPDVADLLRDYLRDRPAGQPVWGGTWASDNKGAEMLRGDLEAAGIPYAVEGPDGPLYADFHALRHTYLTLGGRAGIDLRTLQELAGHSTPDPDGPLLAPPAVRPGRRRREAAELPARPGERQRGRGPPRDRHGRPGGPRSVARQLLTSCPNG